MSQDVIFKVVDYRGKDVIFTREKLEQKQSDHPELHKKAFIECLKKTISEPDEVWEDYQDKENKLCYYRKYSSVSYAKVVVWVGSNPCNIVTAYEIDNIKESNYPNLKRLI